MLKRVEIAQKLIQDNNRSTIINGSADKNIAKSTQRLTTYTPQGHRKKTMPYFYPSLEGDHTKQRAYNHIFYLNYHLDKFIRPVLREKMPTFDNGKYLLSFAKKNAVSDGLLHYSKEDLARHDMQNPKSKADNEE
jgi:hypothetical protein